MSLALPGDDLALLELALEQRCQVEIEVSDCLYGCCARPPARRGGYLQVYRGVIASLDERRLVLHAIAVSSLNYYVIAELTNLNGVALVD